MAYGCATLEHLELSCWQVLFHMRRTTIFKAHGCLPLITAIFTHRELTTLGLWLGQN